MVQAERKVTDDRVNKIIQFKEKVMAGVKEPYGFVVINQKGIDPASLDMLQRAGIIGIRRAKRRNMERLSRACGGECVNSVEELSESCLGFAKTVYEHVLGEDKFTFIEGCKNPTACTILVKGPNDHTIKQVQDAIRDGNRALKNLLEDQSLVPGGGAFELAAHLMLHKEAKQVEGKARVGVMAFADALLVIPKTLSDNSSFDTQQTMQDLLSESAKGARVGLDLDTGKPMLPEKVGVWDNTRVKRQLLQLGSMIAIKLLLVDEVIRAGKKVDKDDS